MLATPGIWEKLTDMMQYTQLVIDTFGHWPDVPPKPIEIAMHYPQTAILKNVGHSMFP